MTEITNSGNFKGTFESGWIDNSDEKDIGF